MPAQLNRVIVSVTDLERALGFYRDILGLAAVTSPGFATLPAGRGLELFLHERRSAVSDLAVAASFATADLDGTCAAWASRGGTVVDPPEYRPWGERMAVVRDPDGHLVCLVQANG